MQLSITLSGVVILVGLVLGTITDLQKREVPDWLNYALIATGISLGLLQSLLLVSAKPILSAVTGLAIGYGIGYVMFYAGQWGGGDSKMIMGLGALYGVSLTLPLGQMSMPPFIIFLINTLLAGAAYGILWAIAIAIIKRRAFLEAFKKLLRQRQRLRITILIATSTFLLGALLLQGKPLLRIGALIFAVTIFTLFYLWTFTKAIEQGTMTKELPIHKLTEGDWIVNDIWAPRKAQATPIAHLKAWSVRQREQAINEDGIIAIATQFGMRKVRERRERKIMAKHPANEGAIAQFIMQSYQKTIRVRCSSKKIFEALQSVKALDSYDEKTAGTLRRHLKEHYAYDPQKDYISGPKDLGIRREQISMLKHTTIKTVTVKEGIPFVPSFLAAHLATILLGNWLVILL